MQEMNREYPKNGIVLRSFTRRVFLMLLLVFAAACTDQQENGNKRDAGPGKEKITVNGIPLVLADGYSLMKGGNGVYNIHKDDSLIVDISDYEFIFRDPAFNYIREQIDYPKMLGGSWASIRIIYGDSSEIRGDLIEMKQDRVFYIDHVMNHINRNNIKDFYIAFMFYIDNGKGQQEIDRFPVHIVN